MPLDRPPPAALRFLETPLGGGPSPRRSSSSDQPQLKRRLSEVLKYCTETAGQMSARTPRLVPIGERAG